eukprot:266719-Chlamydomonas_euryale.AAC.13
MLPPPPPLRLALLPAPSRTPATASAVQPSHRTGPRVSDGAITRRRQQQQQHQQQQQRQCQQQQLQQTHAAAPAAELGGGGITVLSRASLSAPCFEACFHFKLSPSHNSTSPPQTQKNQPWRPQSPNPTSLPHTHKTSALALTHRNGPAQHQVRRNSRHVSTFLRLQLQQLLGLNIVGDIACGTHGGHRRGIHTLIQSSNSKFLN